MPYLQKVIVNVISNSVEGLKWYDSRLFSCGLDGYIVEYDCFNESVLVSENLMNFYTINVFKGNFKVVDT